MNKCEYLLLGVSGQLNEHISYAWRQRIHKKIDQSDMFDATDWMCINYKFDPHWSVAAGKQVAMVGGYEYDRSPLDIYLASEFWNNVAPFQFGASASYTTTNGKSCFTAQVTQSLFNIPSRRDMLAYHLHWAGKYGWFNSLYSLNMIEYAPQRFISYIALVGALGMRHAETYAHVGIALGREKLQTAAIGSHFGARHHTLVGFGVGAIDVVGELAVESEMWQQTIVETRHH